MQPTPNHAAAAAPHPASPDDPDAAHAAWAGTDDRADPGRPKDSSLAAAAAVPGIDPCDVACEAMPAQVDHDLAPADVAWLFEHTADCDYCARILTGYERVDDALGRLRTHVEGAPPPFHPSLTASPAPPVRYAPLDSPIGPLRVAVSDAGVCEVGFARSESEAVFLARLRARGLDPHPDPTLGDAEPTTTAGDRAVAQLREYFAGERDRFDVPLDLSGVTPFTRAVLTATAEVPFGRLSTYGQIAAQIGRPGGSRAVGNALGRNPIPVIVPCHRVVRSDHTLGGYTGGPWIKERLLAIEGVTLPGLSALPAPAPALASAS